MADKEPKGAAEQHAATEPPKEGEKGSVEPKGIFERVFAGTHGEARANLLDSLIPNSSRMFTVAELAQMTGLSTTKVESALDLLLNLEIVVLEGTSLTTGSVGYRSGELGYPLATFYGRWRSLKAASD